MIYGHARFSNEGRSVTARRGDLTAAGAVKAFQEVANGAKANRQRLHPDIGQLGPGDVFLSRLSA